MTAKIRKWTANIVDIVEIIYALDTYKCVDDGDDTLEGLSDLHWLLLGCRHQRLFQQLCLHEKEKRK